MTDLDQQVLKAVGLLAQRALDREPGPIERPGAWLSVVGRRIRDERGDLLRELIRAGATAEEAADALDRPPTLDEILDRIGHPGRAKAVAATQAEAREQEAQMANLRLSTERIRADRAAWRPPSAEERLAARCAIAQARRSLDG